MFNKKIIASALIWSLSFTLFPTNIFANNNLTEAERKICEKYSKTNKEISDLRFSGSWDIYFVESAWENKFYNLLKNGEIIIENKNFFNSEALRNDYNVSKYDYSIVWLSDIFHKEYSYDPYEENYFMNNEKVIVVEENENWKVKITLSNWEIFNWNIIWAAMSWFIIFTHKNNIEISENNLGGFDSKISSQDFEINNWTLKVFDENKKLLTEIKNFKFKENYHNQYIGFVKKENWDTYVFPTSDIGPEYFNIKNIYKNWKPLCENLENNSGNTWNTNNWNTTIVSGGSPVSNPEDLKLKNDPRVLDQNNSSNTTKTEETKKEEKISENKNSTNSSLSENEKNSIKILVENIFKKYSHNKNLLENLYKALTTREDIQKMAETNPRVKFVIEEYKKQYFDFMIKL